MTIPETHGGLLQSPSDLLSDFPSDTSTCGIPSGDAVGLSRAMVGAKVGTSLGWVVGSSLGATDGVVSLTTGVICGTHANATPAENNNPMIAKLNVFISSPPFVFSLVLNRKQQPGQADQVLS